MAKKIDWIETIGIIGSVILLVALSFYHVSWKQYLGIDQVTWNVIGAISGNLLYIVMALIIWAIGYSPVLSKFFLYINGYFLIKIFYHITCYLGIYVWSPQVWENTWSIIVIFYILFLLYMGFEWTKKKY